MSGVFSEDYAAYYDLLYRDKDYATEAGYVAGLLKHHGVNGNAILELGSGTGRHALELVRMGYEVLGVDRSEAMVRIASQRRAQDAGGRSKFQTGDARTFR